MGDWLVESVNRMTDCVCRVVGARVALAKIPRLDVCMVPVFTIDTYVLWNHSCVCTGLSTYIHRGL